MVAPTRVLLSKQTIECPKKLFRFLMRQCRSLPAAPSQHYQHFIRQSFKQHVEEKDPERIKQIMERSLEDAEWIMKKYKVATKESSGGKFA